MRANDAEKAHDPCQVRLGPPAPLGGHRYVAARIIRLLIRRRLHFDNSLTYLRSLKLGSLYIFELEKEEKNKALFEINSSE